MAKNSYERPTTFVMANLLSQKFWMLAWKKRAFDAILGFDTDGIQNLDQDLYRQITSYAWSEMNEQLCNSLEDDFHFVGNHVTKADDGSGVDVKRPRKTLALEKIGDSIEKKASEIVSEKEFKAYFLSNSFLKKREEWAARVADLRAAKEVPVVVVQGVAVEDTQPSSRVDAIAKVAASAASSAVASASARDHQVDVSVTVSVASTPIFPVPPPPPSPAPVLAPAPPPPAPPAPPAPPPSPALVPRGSRMAKRSFPFPAAAPAAPPVAPPATAPAGDEVLDCEMLQKQFGETAIWSRSGVSEDMLEATRIVVSGFRFYSKYRSTPSARTKGQRDSYCFISKGSRAERLACAAGLPLKKASDRTLRSKKDIQRFWEKIVAAGVQISLVK